MRQLHILFNSAKTWHVIVCWSLCFPPNLPELNLKLFWTSEQINFRFSSGKFGGKHRNQQTIACQVLAVSYSLSCTRFHLWHSEVNYATIFEKTFSPNDLSMWKNRPNPLFSNGCFCHFVQYVFFVEFVCYPACMKKPSKEVVYKMIMAT